MSGGGRVRGAAKYFKPHEVEDLFWPLQRWPDWARRLWFNGLGPGSHLQRYSLWKFFWFNGLDPEVASKWVLAGYWGDDLRHAIREAERWERFASDPVLTDRYLLRGRMQDLASRMTINLETEEIVSVPGGFEIRKRTR